MIGRLRDRLQVPSRGWLRVVVALCAVCVIGAALRAVWPQMRSAVDVVSHEPERSLLGALACLAGGLTFVVLRALLLQRSARMWGIDVDLVRASRVFVEGVCVEVVAWPGKVWADAYRQRRLSEVHVLRARVCALVTFRGSTIAGSVCAIGLCAACASGRWSMLLLVPVALAARSVLSRSRAREETKLSIARATRLAVLGCAATLVDALAFGACAWAMAGADAMVVAPLFVLAGFAAGVSTVPMGVGVLDAGLYTALVHGAGVEEGAAVAIIAVYRAAGPMVTLVLGATSAGQRWFFGRRIEVGIGTSGRSRTVVQESGSLEERRGLRTSKNHECGLEESYPGKRAA